MAPPGDRPAKRRESLLAQYLLGACIKRLSSSAEGVIFDSQLESLFPLFTMENPELIEAPAGAIAVEARAATYEDLRRFLFLCLALLGAALIVGALGPLVMLLVVVFFLVAVLNPIVVWLEKRRLPRGLAVALVLLGLLGTLVGVGFLVVPPIVEQTSALAKNSDTYSRNIAGQMQVVLDRFPQLQSLLPEKVQDADNLKQVGRALSPQFENWVRLHSTDLTGFVVSMLQAAAGGALTFLLALLLTLFVLLNPAPLISGFLCAVPARYRDAAGRSIGRIENQMLAWIRATLINGLITGISTGLLLWWIGVKPPLVFGALAFFGEFIPNIGPFIAAVPALFVAAGMGGQTFLLTGAAILFVQQVESNVLVPFIMGKQLELHPFSIIFFALAFGSLFGLAGAILAVPAAAVVKVLFDEFYLQSNRVPTEHIAQRSEVLVREREWKN